MANDLETYTEDGEVVVGQLPTGYGNPNASLAVSLARAEVDQQIATARAMPRSIKRATDNVLTLATLDEESAAECVYALPRGGKPIKGPSIRLAEIIAGQWGNCRVGARVVHVDRFEKFVEAEGVFHDLETNTATTARVRRRISDKNGRLLSDDMIIVTGNAACAIAKRNAILGGVPKAVWRRAFTAVESVIAGDVKTLSERRPQAMKAFAAFGVKPEQIFAALDIGGIEDIGLEEITTLMGMHAALKSGEANVEEMFPTKPAAGGKPKDMAAAMDKLAGGGDAATDAAKKSGKGRAKAADDLPPAGDGEPKTAEGDGVAKKGVAVPADGIEREVDLSEGEAGGDPSREQSPIDAAWEKGHAARKKGLSKRSAPKFPTPQEAAAWLDGWSTADTETSAEG